MKNRRNVLSVRLFGLAVIVLAISMAVLPLTGCTNPADSGGDKNQTPTVADFDIGDLTKTAGSNTAVTITPKQGKSGGKITIYYEGTGNTTYPKSTTPPTAEGTYIVTFDVAAATGFNAANGLSAGTLTIGAISPINKTLVSIAVTTHPTKTQYNIGDELSTAGMVVTATYDDGTTAAVTGYTTSGYDKTKEGNHEITVTYQGKTAKFSVNVIDPSKPTVATPTASPSGGAVAAGTTITLSTTPADAEIWYTTDGSVPAKNGAGSTKYTAAFAITPPVTVKAAAFKDGMNDSDVLEAVYTLMPITNAGIDITAPVYGETPATAIDGEAEHFTAGTVTWSPTDNPFKPGTEYTATITLTAKSDYTFTASTTATVNGQTATISNNTGTTVTLTYKFPATDTKKVTNMVIKTPPANLTYTHGDTLDLSGMEVTLTYEDETTEDVTAANFAAKGITASPSAGDKLVHSTHNGHPVTITCGSLTKTTGNLIVNAINISALTIEPASIAAVTYTGSAFTPALTVKYGETTLTPTTDYTVSYTNNTNAGTATITVTCVGNYTGTKTINFTINKANPASWPTATAITYGEALSTSTLTGGDTAAGTFTWQTPTTVPPVTNSGYTVIFNPTNTTNYNVVTRTINITVNKANPTVTAWPTAAAIDLGLTLSASALSGGTSTPAGTFAWTTPATIPSAGTNAYSVTFTPTDAANYNTMTNNVSVTVNKPTFNSIADLATWLSTASTNTAATKYEIALNVSDISTLRATLNGAANKYVSIDCSGSTFTTVPAETFYGATSPYGTATLTGITLPSGVTTIGNSAFRRCANLASINIPNVTIIDQFTFYGCSSLTSVTIPNTVTYIYRSAFYECTGLTSVTIPNTVTNIAASVFSGCTGLTSVILPTNPNFTSIEDTTFYGCAKLTSITIPNTVTIINQYAFSNCSSLASVTFEATSKVASIGTHAFDGCSSLTSITIPNTVGSIQELAFTKTGLTSVVFLNRISKPNLERTAFDGDLYDRFYDLGSGNDGYSGTYTRPNSTSLNWTRQP